MASQLKICLAQLDPTVGDLEGNVARLLEAHAEAAGLGADLVLTGELGVVGYPPEDLLLRREFLSASEAAVERLCAATAPIPGNPQPPALLVGAPLREERNGVRALYNALFLLDQGRIAGVHRKTALPNQGVFDEQRHFTAAPLHPVGDEGTRLKASPVNWRGHRLALLLCEDAWQKQPLDQLAAQGATCFLVANASPWDPGKAARRRDIMAQRAAETGLHGAYVNIVGAQEDLVFDGSSFTVTNAGAISAQLPSFQEAIALVELSGGMRDEPEENSAAARKIPMRAKIPTPATAPMPAPPLEELRYRAILTGIRGYLRKSGFHRALLGLSGGIDSALTLTLAVDAIGHERVRAFLLPSEHTSPESRQDALDIAKRLKVEAHEISITPAHHAVRASLAPFLGPYDPDRSNLAEENLQPRLRGLILMALSNYAAEHKQDKHGATQNELLLATGNKSEIAVGYATLYGDLCGGFAPLKDLYKTQVYELARYRNEQKPDDALGPPGLIFSPQILDKPPSAELRPGQTDQDTLPPYETLDAMLRAFLEENAAPHEIIAAGYPRELVQFTYQRLAASEYKRRQAPPGPRLSSLAFARERRWPIHARFQPEMTPPENEKKTAPAQ